MKLIHVKSLRLAAAMLVTAAVLAVNSIAMHAPTPSQSPVTLKNIHTDRSTTFYVDHRPACAWFVEAVYADHRPACAWFVEAVMPSGDSTLATENLKSVVATL